MHWYFDSNNILVYSPTRRVIDLKKKSKQPVEPLPEINPNYEKKLENMRKRLIKEVK